MSLSNFHLYSFSRNENLFNYEGKMSSDNYEIGDRLGEGGFGTVYRCIDKRDHRTYAMKIIKFNPLLDREKKEKLVENVMREIEILRI